VCPNPGEAFVAVEFMIKDHSREKIDERLCKVKGIARLQGIVLETMSIGARMACEK
jgi:hypothetical protein